ncbi:MAG: acetylxylan esterase, partial [Opitutaceae bacterium]
PLLIANSDKDPIFPLDGVIRVHSAAARIYALHKASDRFGLLITEGPHKDTQDLQVPAFRWFNRFLKREEPLITTAAEKLFEPRDLRVFAPGGKPTDERTTRIHETFVATARPALPADNAAWTKAREGWRRDLRAKSFAGWPASEEPLRLSKTGGDASGSRWEFTTQGPVRLPLLVHPPAGGGRPTEVILRVVDRDEPPPTAPAGAAVVTFFPRGLGPTSSTLNTADQNEVRRRYLLLGQTVDGMRVWDIRRAVAALRSPELFGDTPVRLVGHRDQAVNALYASLFIDGLTAVELRDAPASHREGPDYLNVLRFLDVPQAVAMAAERQPVSLPGADREAWNWAAETARRLRWPADRLKF